MRANPTSAGSAAGDDERFLRVRAVAYRLGQSLFFLPAVLLGASVVLAELTVALDRRLEDDGSSVFETSADNARAVLGSIAGGTITAASVVFSLTLLAVQLSSSQFSPRSLGNFLGDRFQQVVIGIVLGSFGYSLAVLREVRGPAGDAGEQVVPGVAVSVAAALAIVALIALVASINHTAQALRVESVVERITEDTIGVVHHRFSGITSPPAGHVPDDIIPEVERDAIFLAAPRRGWVQQLSPLAMAEAVPADTVLHLTVTVGDHVMAGAPLVYAKPPPDEVAATRERLLRAIVIGPRRTLQQDVAFGLLQLNDVALRALSPGINDPNTAVDVVARVGSILVEVLSTDPPARSIDHHGRRIVRVAEPDHESYVHAGWEPIIRHARGEPEVLVALARSLRAVGDEVARRRPDTDLAVLDSARQRVAVQATHLDHVSDRERVLAALER